MSNFWEDAWSSITGSGGGATNTNQSSGWDPSTLMPGGMQTTGAGTGIFSGWPSVNTSAASDAVAAATGGGNMFNNGEGFLGTMLSSKGADGIERQGWGGMALGLGQGLLSGYQGMQQYGMAKDAFEESKRRYEKNYAAQKQITNADLEDRQRARVASNAGAYQSVSEYMNKNGIK